MEHNHLIAASLREGIRVIQAHRKERFANNPLRLKWNLLYMAEGGLDAEEHDLIDDCFARKSKTLLSRIRDAA